MNKRYGKRHGKRHCGASLKKSHGKRHGKYDLNSVMEKRHGKWHLRNTLWKASWKTVPAERHGKPPRKASQKAWPTGNVSVASLSGC